MKRVLFKIIVPIALITVWMLTCYQVCNKTEGFDWFLYWIIVGCPFGIRRMCFWLIPKNFGISGSIGILALNCILGGLSGGIVLIVKIISRGTCQCGIRALLDKKSKGEDIELLDFLSKGGAVRLWLLFY